MGFIDAIEFIARSTELELCEDEKERDGRHSCICVYRTSNGAFVGKIRFADENGRFAPSIDEELVTIIEQLRTS